jgi:hypothetical protein
MRRPEYKAMIERALRHSSIEDSSWMSWFWMGIFILSNWLGLRSKELAALKVKDVYENGKVKDTLRLLAGYTKGEKHRDLALANPEVIKAISRSGGAISPY